MGGNYFVEVGSDGVNARFSKGSRILDLNGGKNVAWFVQAPKAGLCVGSDHEQINFNGNSSDETVSWRDIVPTVSNRLTKRLCRNRTSILLTQGAEGSLRFFNPLKYLPCIHK